MGGGTLFQATVRVSVPSSAKLGTDMEKSAADLRVDIKLPALGKD